MSKAKVSLIILGFLLIKSYLYTIHVHCRRGDHSVIMCHTTRWKKKYSQFGCVLGFILCTKQLLCNDMSFYFAGFVQKYHTIAITIDNAYMYSQITDLITFSGIKCMYTSKLSFNKTL